MYLTREILNEVLVLAKKYKKEFNSNTAVFTALQKYLYALDHEMLIDLIAMMYLGKNERYEDVAAGLQRFNMVRQDHEDQWDNKELLINQITDKYMLYDYLCNALDIING